MPATHTRTATSMPRVVCGGGAAATGYVARWSVEGDKNVETVREFLRNCLRLVSPKEHQANRVQDDLEILQLVDQRNAAIFERLIHGGISGSAGQEHDPVS